jgi:hypothetical protein
MVVLTLEAGYTSATTERGIHEVHKEHVVALAKKSYYVMFYLPEVSYVDLIRISVDEISALLVLMNNFKKYHFRKLCFFKCIIEVKYRTGILNNHQRIYNKQTEVQRWTEASACCFTSHVTQ